MKFLDNLLKAKAENMHIVIPDIKVFSPKEGDLLKNRDPKEYAKILIEAGAPAISVVTEEKEFHGSMKILKTIADEAAKYNIPVLRKDFIHTFDDLIETKQNGASAILLMCSCLEPDELKKLYYKALELGLDPLIETHESNDFELVKELGAKLIGVNNRNIKLLERDNGCVRDKLDMIEAAPKEAFLIAESSIASREDVCLALNHGADAALVGTAILKAKNTKSFYKMLTSKVSIKICGLMNAEDVTACLDAGVDRIGFVVEYPVNVPWNLDRDKAKELLALIPSGFKKVVVTGGNYEHIIEIARELSPDAIQFHCTGDLHNIAYIASELKKNGIDSIMTFPMKSEDQVAHFGTNNLSEIIKQLDATDISEFLIDPRQGDAVGVNNLKADENLFIQVTQLTRKNVMLAGGLNSYNLAQILSRTNAKSVDIMTGCEEAPGRKNHHEIRKLAEIAHNSKM